MTIPVIWLWLNDEPHNGFWDWQFIEDLTSDSGFQHHHGSEIPEGVKGSIVVIAARNQKDKLREINKELSKLDWCLVMLTGDEANVFPFESLNHPRMKVYVMHPRPGRHDSADRFMINSYAPDTKMLKKYKDEYIEKPLDWFFAGQLGHKRREECVSALESVPNGELHASGGFTQGLDHDEYFKGLASAKFAPCPSGPAMPDTFRLYEALEAGCIPIVDSGPDGYPGGFWENLFGEVPPFPILEDWGSVQGTVNDLSPRWKEEANKIFSWWQRKKRQYRHELESDLFHLSGVEPTDKITVMMPSSPIPSHPSTEIITETIGSIRERLDCEILVQLDGVRSEQENRRHDYEDYKRDLLWDCNWEYERVIPYVFDSHHHQSLMAKATIDEVKTPYLLYVESDTPLVDEIDFENCMENLNKFNLIRFSHEAVIPQPHHHMMLDDEPKDGFIRTVQWSQRPHLCRTEFYRWLLAEYFEWGKRAFIEHKMYGVILEEYELHGYAGWQKYAMAIYAPEEDNIRRSANLNGRGKDRFYESEL